MLIKTFALILILTLVKKPLATSMEYARKMQ